MLVFISPVRANLSSQAGHRLLTIENLGRLTQMAMQPPISIGTVLQNRYRILQVLGQGGFGRTYLAADQGRFNEYCALKEFIPPHTSDYALVKSKELFEREASVLYQIQHPQVPQFRAIFEEDQRLFLVQDYVEGKPYSTLLGERLSVGQVFSGDEVQRFIQQLLPVLAHLHSKGIIHRDISPDNVMFRQQDGLPVLIDFGVVKAVATQLRSDMGGPTTVGKPGYAPSEQIHGGQVFPSSDLYALAVTAIVLLTGRQPTELLDSNNFIWRWRQFAPNTMDPLASVLDRMLNLRPGDRYQSSSEVMQALQGWGAAPTMAPPTNAPPAVSPPPAAAVGSSMPTVAVGRPAEATYVASSAGESHAPVSRPSRAATEARESSFFDDPLAIAAVGVGLAALTGVGLWTFSSVTGSRNVTPPTPTVTQTTLPPTPIATATTATPTATVTQAPQPQQLRQALDLQPGQVQRLQDALPENATLDYEIRGEQGQTLNTFVSGEGISMSVLDSNGDPLDDRAKGISNWEGTLPYTGPYTLRLRPASGAPRRDFRLEVGLENPPTPTATPTPTAPASPVYTENTVSLSPGTEDVRNGEVGPNRIQRYRVQLDPNEILSAKIIEGNASFMFFSPNGQPVPDMTNSVEAKVQAPNGGNYTIEVTSQQPANFGISIRLDGAPEPPPPPPPPAEATVTATPEAPQIPVPPNP